MTEALTLAALVGVGIFLWVLYLYRKGRLKEDHALLWILVSIGIVILSMWTDLLLGVSRIFSESRTTDIVVAAFIGFLLVMCIYFSVKISDLTEQSRRMAQELAVTRTMSHPSTSKDEKSSK